MCVYFTFDTKSKGKKGKIQKVGLPQTKSFCTAKDIVNNKKNKPGEWKKIFSNHTSDKELVFKLYKGFIWLNIKKL